MKKYRKQGLVLSALFISLIILPCIVNAQPPDGGQGDPDAPIDGGISLLVAAGIGYGLKKSRENKKKKTIDLL